MIFFRVTSLLFILCLLISFPAGAEDISVDSSSDIQSLIDEAVANQDVLVFEPGTYEVNIELTKNLDLRGRDTTNTFLVSANGSEPAISINDVNNISIRNFTFSDNDVGIRIFDSVAGVDITNNVFENNVTAIDAGNFSNIDIENNTFFNNDLGIDDSNSGAEIRIYQNIFFNNSVTFSNSANFAITYNCFNVLVDDITGVNENIDAEVSFVDQEEGDFHLTEDSECREKGETEDDLGAYGGINADFIPNAVVISGTEKIDTDSVTVSWNENLDYRVEGYKVYYSISELKGLHSFSDRENISFVDAEDNLEVVVTGLDVSATSPEKPALLSVTPRDKKLLVRWTQSEDATSYTLYYQGQGDSEKNETLGAVDSYTILDLSNDITYDVWLVAHFQKQYHFQVAAYLESSTESDFRESSFVLNDTTVDIGEKADSVISNKISARPEKIVAYPDLPNEGCFIATAAFGYYSAHEVQILRDFRDQTLLTTEFGASFVHWYYEHGPKAANVINKYEFLKSIVRVALYPLIISVALINISFTLFILTLLALIAGSVMAFLSIANRNKVAL